MENNNSSKKSFWQTLPGIFTALAAIITAVTGLLLAFNQIGLFKHSKENQTVNTTSSQQSNTTDTTKKISSVDEQHSNNIGTVKFSMTDIKGKGALSDYTILEPVVEPKDPSTNILKIKIRYSNYSSYQANFWDRSFRLSVDGVLIEPTSNLDELVASNASKEGIIQFEFSNAAKKLELVIFDGNDKINVPFTITAD